MSLTLEGNGFAYQLPPTLDLRELSQKTPLDEARVVGRRGVLLPKREIVPAGQELVLSGYLWAATPSALRTAFAELAETLHSGELLLTDADLNRTARVRLRSFAYERVAGSAATTLRLSARLLVPDGVWQDAAHTRQAATITLVNAAPVVRNLAIAYTGTAPAAPTLNVTLNSGATWTPTITWKGDNLVQNPSFEEGLSTPTGWAVHAGSPRLAYGTARSGIRCASVSAGDTWRQIVPVNGGQTHTLSGYVRTPSSGTADVQIQWKDSAGGLINTTSTTVAATASWTRFVLTGQSSTGAAAEAWVLLGATSGTVEYDDVQLEEASSASSFADVAHRSFTRSASLAYASGHRLWAVDMEAGTVRLRDSANVWTDDLKNTNGRFFALHAVNGGRQHVFVGAPAGATLDVEIVYRAKYA
jgi:hypothetical protein